MAIVMKGRTFGALAVAWLAAAVLVGAQGTQQTPPPKPTPPPTTQTPPTADPQTAADSDAAEYKIGVGDKIEIQVTNFTEYSATNMLVPAGGKIQVKDLPNAVLVKDLTAHEVEALLIRLWMEAELFSRKPQVIVTVIDFRSQKVFLQGEVRTQGEVALKGNEMTLSRAIVAAGGYNTAAGQDVEIRRAGKTFTYNRKDLDAGVITDPKVLPEDMIFVAKAPIYFVNGYVKSPGEKTWEQGVTVGRAIQLAGGVTTDGSMNGLKIRRLNTKSNEYELIDVKAETKVLKDDEVIVRKKLM